MNLSDRQLVDLLREEIDKDPAEVQTISFEQDHRSGLRLTGSKPKKKLDPDPTLKIQLDTDPTLKIQPDTDPTLKIQPDTDPTRIRSTEHL